jgi:hypothetical protein
MTIRTLLGRLIEITRRPPPSLTDWNERRAREWHETRDRVQNPHRYSNGLGCPRCGGALYDTGQQVSVSPSILRVRCQRCFFKGERYE